MFRLPTLTDPHPSFGPMFRLSIRLRLAGYGRRYGAALRFLARFLDVLSGHGGAR